MKVEFSPVNFKSGIQPQSAANVQTVSNPLTEALALDQEHASKSKNKVELFNYRLHDDNWSKSYDFSTNTVHVKFPNSFDGTEYFIGAGGKVTETNGWTSPVVILDKHEDLAKYVQEMKDYQTKSAGSYTQTQQTNKGVAFGAGSVWEGFTSPEKSILSAKVVNSPAFEKSTSPVKSEEKPEVQLQEEKIDSKSPADASEKTEVPAKSQDAEPKHKTTFKEKIANVWKFFTNLGQMTAAAVKGLLYAGATAVTLLAGSWLFNTLPKAFSKEGPKFVQIIKQPLKNISKSGKVIAGIGAALVFGYHLIAGRLSANQKTAVIDHKLHVGHRDV